MTPITAPILIFTYDRPAHTRRTVESLQKNLLAEYSEVFFYADGAKSENDRHAVDEVRHYIKSIKGFKKISIIERTRNYGLSANIIDGVSEILSKHPNIIVLEDDIVTGPYFLKFMNESLSRFESNDQIWHISGWSHPILPDGLADCYFWRGMDCWGWATWADRWAHFEKKPHLLKSTWSRDKIFRFNIDGADNLWRQVEDNISNNINTWAIFWYATIFDRNGLCLSPTVSLVNNIGFDGSGENCGVSADFHVNLSKNQVNSWPICIEESTIALKRIKQFYLLKKIYSPIKLATKLFQKFRVIK
ncbi:glycosyltransferase [Methylomonas sp. OY6]|uniref:Glycosyltransferase n=1 Tax=Methylomonas defluvii TaxID=3045149 RepID=A0ABU4UAQ8_9GAMM|nr:glycosyltransferase [Methylomonas sp. OY6]MDX8126529.1 glycosyltransferase [Methylomonas sp. OY6]